MAVTVAVSIAVAIAIPMAVAMTVAVSAAVIPSTTTAPVVTSSVIAPVVATASNTTTATGFAPAVAIIPAVPAVPAVPASAIATSTSGGLWRARRVGRVEGESDSDITRRGLDGASHHLLSAHQRAKSDRDRGSTICVGDRTVGVELTIRDTRVEAKDDRCSWNQASAGISRFDDQRRRQRAVDCAALSVTRDRAQIGRPLLSRKGDVAVAGAEAEEGGSEERQGLETMGSETVAAHTMPAENWTTRVCLRGESAKGFRSH
jgi:hypothetical protein